MITTPTTFVTGAGTSHSFGLPLGKELLQLARGLQPEHKPYQVVVRALGGSDQALTQLNGFLQDLRNHPTNASIDAYLEARRHREERLRAGKAVIAALLGNAISAPGEPDRDDRWLEHVLETMREDARTLDRFLHGNAVKFITFNFDRTLEDRLVSFAAPAFDCSSSDCVADLHALVTHVHGMVPPVPPPPFQNTADWVQWVQQAIDEIKVTGDEIPSEIRSRATDAMCSASVVCFLGFAYSPDNVRQIDCQGALTQKTVFGSAYLLRGGQQAAIKGRLGLPLLELGGENDKSEACLKKFHVLRD